jgi:hypothetical protein
MNERVVNYLIAIGFLMLLAIIVKARRRFTGPLQRIARGLSKQGPVWKKCLQPKVLVLLFILALGISVFKEVYLDFSIVFWLLVFAFIASLAHLIKSYTEKDMRLPWHPMIVMALLFMMLPLVAYGIFQTWEFLTLGLVLALITLSFLMLLIKTIQATMQQLKKAHAKEQKE